MQADSWELLKASAPNPYTERRHLAPADGVVIGSMLVPLKEYRTSDFYRSAASRLDMVHKLAVIVSDSDTRYGSLSMFRAENESDYSKSELDIMRRLGPHLRRAAEIATRFAQLEGQTQMLVEGLNELPFGIILVDARSGVVFANFVADKVLREGAPVGTSRAPASTGSIYNGIGLDMAISRAVGRGGPRESSTAVTELGTNRRPLPVTVLPLVGACGRFGALAPKAAAAIVFRDPDTRCRLEIDHLRQMWRLTVAEANLALDLLSGVQPLEHARRRGITENTLRTHLRNVKSKLGVSKISDLIALLAAHSL